MLRLADVLVDASRVLSDPLVQLDLALAGRVLAYKKRVSSREELEKLLLRLSERAKDSCVSIVMDVDGAEARLLTCDNVIVAAIYKSGSTLLLGEKAFERIIEEVSSRGAVVDARAVPKDRIPEQLKPFVERAARAALPAGRPPLVWIGSVLYGFKVERVAGEGGISYVLEAYGPQGRVALKILREKSRFGGALAIGNRGAIESFARTGTAMMRLTFPSKSIIEASLEEKGIRVTGDKLRVFMGFSENVIKVYGVYVPRDEYRSLEEYVKQPPTMVMEYIDGIPLNKLEKTLSAFEARKIVFEVAGALALAHLQGFGHFDIKPQNVLVEKVGGFLRAKLFDFTALPINLRRAPVLEEITPEYTDPYALLHGARAYPSYDVYSLGLLAYRLFYKRLPYARIALNYVVLRRVLPSLAEKIKPYLPPETNEHVRRFERLAETRRDPDTFLRAAQELLDTLEPLTPPPGQPQSIVYVLRRMLALLPEERFGDAVEVVRELATYFNISI